jgi:hypothetical protein
MVISFLKELWNNPDKYPGIIDCMKQADPEHWFESKEQEVEVAHKYGYVTDDWRDHLLYVNDCGFCYTEEPVAIVLFTRAVGDPEGLLADYCALAIDYNQYRTELDKQKAEKEEAEAALKEEEEAAKAKAKEEAAAAKAAEREKEKEANRKKRAAKSVGTTVAGTVGRELGKKVGKQIGGKFGQTLGGNTGAQLFRGILNTLLK